MREIFKMILIAVCSSFLLCSCANNSEKIDDIQVNASSDTSSESEAEAFDAAMVCTEYNGRVNSVYEENGEMYFSITDYNEDGTSDNYEFVISQHSSFDNADLIDEFEELDVVKVYSFVSPSEQIYKIPAHIVIRVDEVGTTFYAIVTEMLNNQLVLKGLDINSLNFRSFYIAHIEEYTSLTFNGAEASLEDFSVGDLVSVRFTQGKSQMYPSELNRTEEIEILVKEYTDEIFDYDA